MIHIKEYDSFNSHSEKLNEDATSGDGIWNRFKSTIGNIFKPTEEPADVAAAPKKPEAPVQKAADSPLVGEHMLYIPHQQGAEGAAKLVRIAKGKEQMSPGLRSNLLNNMPSSDPGYATVKTGKSIAAVMAYLNYQKSTWEGYKKEAMQKITEPKNAAIKTAIKNVTKPQFPFDFLATVAYKESRFVPNPPTNKSYRGLFQIGDMAWKELKRQFPAIYKGSRAPINPAKNTQAGHDLLVAAYNAFEKKIGDLA
jgi:hypothetical protein